MWSRVAAAKREPFAIDDRCRPSRCSSPRPRRLRARCPPGDQARISRMVDRNRTFWRSGAGGPRPSHNLDGAARHNWTLPCWRPLVLFANFIGARTRRTPEAPVGVSKISAPDLPKSLTGPAVTLGEHGRALE